MGSLHESQARLIVLRQLASRHLFPALPPPSPLPPPDREWLHLVALAEAQCVGGLIYWNLQECATAHSPHDASWAVWWDACPAVGRARLREEYHRNIARNLMWRQELARLVPAFQEAGLHAIVLRGLTLLGSCYPDEGMRSSDDCDLCVRPQDRARAEAVLLQMGYEPCPSGVHLFVKGPLYIDLHTAFGDQDRLASDAGLHRIDAASVWRDARPFPIDGGALLRLSPVDDLLLSALHLLRHEYERLIWKLDLLTMLLRLREPVAWEQVVARAEAFGLTFPLACAIAYGEVLAPQDLRGALATVPITLSPGLARRLFAALRQEQSLEGLSALLRSWMIPRPLDRLRFLAEAFIPASRVRAGMREEWRQAGQPRSFLGDRCVKLVRVARSLGRLLLAG